MPDQKIVSIPLRINQQIIHGLGIQALPKMITIMIKVSLSIARYV